MGDRQFEPRVYTAIKAGFATFVDKHFGYQKVAAGRTRVGQQAISDYMSQNAPEFVPSDVLLDLCKASGDVAPLDQMADFLGYRLARKGGVHTSADSLDVALRAATESAETTTSVLKAAADGRFTLAECADLRAHLRREIAAAEQLDDHLAMLEARNG